MRMRQLGRNGPHVAALTIRFTADELDALNRDFGPGAIRGDRYPPLVMRYAAH
jgi:hypothetical protein